MTFENCKWSKWEKSWGDEKPLLSLFWGELSGWSPQYMRIILHTKVENTSVKSNGEKKINKKLIINNKKIFFYLNNFYLNYFFTWTASRCLSYYFFFHTVIAFCIKHFVSMEALFKAAFPHYPSYTLGPASSCSHHSVHLPLCYVISMQCSMVGSPRTDRVSSQVSSQRQHWWKVVNLCIFGRLGNFIWTTF